MSAVDYFGILSGVFFARSLSEGWALVIGFLMYAFHITALIVKLAAAAAQPRTTKKQGATSARI